MGIHSFLFLTLVNIPFFLFFSSYLLWCLLLLTNLVLFISFVLNFILILLYLLDFDFLNLMLRLPLLQLLLNFYQKLFHILKNNLRESTYMLQCKLIRLIHYHIGLILVSHLFKSENAVIQISAQFSNIVFLKGFVDP